MTELRTFTTTTTMAATADAPPLHTVKPMPHTIFNRVFAPIYGCAILALFYHHGKNLLNTPNIPSFCLILILIVSDIILTFMWINMEALRMYPVRRQDFPENLKRIMMKESEYPSVDVFICTADPYKEPPICVVNTALSVMAYDYPREKISVYVSDDGGSSMTMFALMEAAKFATYWLPFCDNNKLLNRSPQAYFDDHSNHSSSDSDAQHIKMMYETMKMKIEKVVERGKVEEDYINGEEEKNAFNKWTPNFTRHDHPTVIQVLLDGSKDNKEMPKLIYVSREKDKNAPHHFKAGALNTLLRVSGLMTNAPIILTLDCDMYSNNPQTPLHVLCYLCDPKEEQEVSKVGYVQFPQRFHKMNKNDIYACAYKKLFDIQSIGLDGLMGPNYVGTGCFFSRRAFFGGPQALVPPEIPQLAPPTQAPRFGLHKSLPHSQSVMPMALHVSTCHYEDNTNWGSKIGFRYGSLVEDYYTGYRLQCEGWKSIFCMPKRPAFLGDAPISLIDLLNQQKRWSIGLLEVAFSKYSPIIFGVKSMGPLMGFGYALLSFWPLWSIPITTYAFLPQLALLNNLYIFPKASEIKWFSMYVFLFIGANVQDLIEFICVGGSIKSWWNDQRIWHIRGVTCYLFGIIEYLVHTLGISKFGFNVTSKADDDDEQRKRYEKGLFEFGIHSPMFITISMVAFINFISLLHGLVHAFKHNDFESPLLQILLSGFVVVNCFPIYEAIFFRVDNGKMAIKTTIMATFFTLCFYVVFSFFFMYQIL